jgi:hypothetical protein
MSFLTKSLEKRIQELRVSIEAQTTELAAYEQVLALESGKPVGGPTEAPASVAAIVAKHTATTHVIKHTPKKKTPIKQAPSKQTPTPTATSAMPVGAEFNGSRSDFVASMLKQRGSSGMTPGEISAAFATRKIPISKNLVYNVLSLMFKQKKARKSNGRYFHTGAKVETPIASSATPKKRRISEEGMRRIIAATKKRWALQRAGKKASR